MLVRIRFTSLKVENDEKCFSNLVKASLSGPSVFKALIECCKKSTNQRFQPEDRKFGRYSGKSFILQREQTFLTAIFVICIIRMLKIC